MQDTLGVDNFMQPVREAIQRHVDWPSDAYTDIYNRAWEAVHNALSSNKKMQPDAEQRCPECCEYGGCKIDCINYTY